MLWTERRLSRKRRLICLSAIILVLAGFIISGMSSFADTPPAYVSTAKVKAQTDGTKPFDDDDERGDDSSDSNRIVRSFDKISYTIEYATALSDETTSAPSDGIKVDVTMELDESPDRATFDDDEMNWIEDKVTTYHYADGSSSTTLDSGKTVTKQVVTGKRTLSSDEIPGIATLTMGVHVGSMVQGEKICPRFTLTAEGTSKTVEVVPEGCTVSSKAQFDVAVYQTWDHARADWYADMTNKTLSRTKDATHTQKVRIYAWGIGLMLYGDSDEKGMRGLELPVGDLYDGIRVTLTHTDGSAADDASVSLWDYSENDRRDKGYLGTDYNFGYVTNYARGASVPYNRTNGGADGDLQGSCYKGGTWSLTEDASKTNLFHTTVTNWALSPTYQFPRLTSEHGGSAYKDVREISKRRMFISTLDLSVAVSLPDSVQDGDDESNASETFLLTCDASGIDIKTTSGAECKETPSAAKSDDRARASAPVYNPGNITKYINDTGYVWSDGKMYAPINGTVNLYDNVSTEGSRVWKAFDYLEKFDTTAYDTSKVQVKQGSQRANNSFGTVTYWYAVKPDGTGWDSDSEMISTRMEQLLYYDSLDKLNASGKTCVGVLQQMRGCSIAGCRDYTYFTCYLPIKGTATPGYVAQATNDLRGWTSTDNPGTVVRDNGDGTYGYGDTTKSKKGDYEDGYTKPDHIQESLPYKKTVYDQGVMTSGNTGGAVHGSSCLIVGAYASIAISPDSEIYDLDKNQRTVTYTVTPRVNDISGLETATRKTTAEVKVTIPSDLHYVTGSSSLKPSDVDEGDDGTTLTFQLDDVTIGSAITPITFEATIGHAGYLDDVVNGQQFEASAQITCPQDPRAVSSLSGNYARTSIQVVKLASLAIIKSVDREHGNVGDPHEWTLLVGNMSDTDTDDVRLIDVLPYDGDNIGSSFHGRYVIDKITVDMSSAEQSLKQITDDATVLWSGDDIPIDCSSLVQSINTADGMREAGFTSMSVSRDGDTFVMTSPTQIASLCLLLPKLMARETVTISIHVTTSGDGNDFTDANGETQQPGDRYCNQFFQYADNQIAMVRSNICTTDVDMASFTMRKEWSGDDAYLEHRPSSVSLKVTGTDGSSRTFTTSAPSWEAQSGWLPRYEADGSRITYSCSEDTPQYYEASVSGGDESGFVVTNTNTYKANGTFSLTGQKRLVGRSFKEGDTFVFHVSGTDTDGKDVPLPSNVDENGDISVSPTSGHATDIDFGSVDITEQDIGRTFTYTFTEVSASDDVSVDETKRVITASINDDAHDGTLDVTLTGENGVSFVDEYTPTPVSVELSVSKRFIGRPDGWLPSDTFEYDVTPIDGVDANGNEVNTEDMPTIDGKEFTPSADGMVTQSSSVTFTSPGTYRYSVSEKDTGIAGILYDTHSAIVTFVVTLDDDSGVMSVDRQIEGPLTFENTYSWSENLNTMSIGISKTLENREWKDSDEFSFGIEAGDDETQKAIDDGVLVIGNEGVDVTSGMRSGEFSDIRCHEPGTYRLTVFERKHSVGGVNVASPTTITIVATDNGDGTLSYSYSQQDIDFTDYYAKDAHVYVPIVGKKVLLHDGFEQVPDIAEKYTFQLQPIGDAPSRGLDRTALNDADGNVRFGTLSLSIDDISSMPLAKDGTRSRTFEYSVSEAGTVDGVTNDDTKTVSVTLIDDGNGNLSATASSTSFVFDNEFSSEASISLPAGTKHVKHNPDDRDDEYTFLLEAGDDETQDAIDKGFLIISTPSVTARDGETFSFDDILVRRPGGYSFRVREEKGDADGITYDATTYDLTYTVTENGTSEMDVEPDADNPTSLDFENEYDATGTASISVRKELDGRTLRESEFSFTLDNDDGTSMTARNDGDGNVTFSDIEYDIEDIGTHTYVIHENDTDEDGVTYDAHTVTVTVTVTDNGDGTLNASVAYDGGTTFQNAFDDKQAPITGEGKDDDDGIEMIAQTGDVVSLIVSLIVTFIGATVILVRDRRKRGER